MTCPQCQRVGVTIVRGAVMRQTPLMDQLFMSIEQWDDKNVQLEKLLARAAHLELGCATFKAAAELFPKQRIQLLDQRRVLADSTLQILQGGKRLP
jgi:hypothetical protein